MKAFTDLLTTETKMAIEKMANESPDMVPHLIEWGNALYLDGQRVGWNQSFILFGSLTLIGGIAILYTLCEERSKKKKRS